MTMPTIYDFVIFTLTFVAIVISLIICICIAVIIFGAIKLFIETYFHKRIVEDMTKSDNIKFNYPVKHICISTCGELYQKWKHKKSLYEKAPKSGVTVEVEYADTASSINNDNLLDTNQVVLALHGAPGHHSDFASIIEHMTENGVRVIAPNFPNYSLTEKTDVFRHSAEEKAEFIKDFLKTIGVNEIDMIIAHSSAIYPSLILWSDPNGPQIHSFAFLNPGGHRRIKAMRPAWYTEGSVKVYQNKLGRTIFKTFGTTFLNITKTVTVKADNMNNVILSAQTMKYSGFRQLEEKLIKLRESKVPILLFFSENDKLIEKEIFYEMADILGVKDENITIYNENGVLEKDCSSDDSKKVITFRSGGHYAFLKYTDDVNKACDELLIKAINSKTIEKDFVDKNGLIVESN